jgi:uncharacterized protein (DUF2141 family)
MNNLFRLALALALVGALWPLATPVIAVQKATLTVKFTGLRNDKGEAQITLYPDEKSWDKEKHSHVGTGPIKGGTATVTLRDLPPGTYGVAALHDENRNGDMDTRFGIPREGVGLSNNPKLSFTSSPGWNDIKLEVPAGEKTIEIKAKYF